MSAWFIEGVFTGRSERRHAAPTAAELSLVLLDREVERFFRSNLDAILKESK